MPQTRYCWPAWPYFLLLTSLNIAPLHAMAIVAKPLPGPQSMAYESLSKAVPRDTSTSSSTSTSTSTSSSSSSELTNAEIGGLVGGLVGMLAVCLAITIWVVRHLRKVAEARQNESLRRSAHRQSAHGSGGGGSGGSGNNGGGGNRTSQQKIVPTPSQVDQLDYDDLLERETTTTLAGVLTPCISGISHTPTVGSSRTMATPMSPDMLGYAEASPDRSISGVGADLGAVSFADLPRVHVQNRPTRRSASSSADSSGQHQQSARRHLRQAHLVHDSSFQSEDRSSNRGTSRQPAELDVDGGIIPELPAALQAGGRREREEGGSARDRESPGWESSAWTRYAPGAARARAISGVSTISNITAPSIGMPQTPDADRYSAFIPSPTHSRDHSGSSASFHHKGYHQQQPRLGMVSENLGQDLHGHYGPTHAVAGQTLAGNNIDMAP